MKEVQKSPKVPKLADMAALLKQSIERGVDYLSRNNKDIQFVLTGAGWNFARPKGKAAKELIKAIDEGMGYSGSQLGSVLQLVIATAEHDLGYEQTSQFIVDDRVGSATDLETDRIVTLRRAGKPLTTTAKPNQS